MKNNVLLLICHQLSSRDLFRKASNRAANQKLSIFFTEKISKKRITMPRALTFLVCILQLTNNGKLYVFRLTKCKHLDKLNQSFFFKIPSGFALKCFKCSSLHDDGCDDNFNYNPAFMFDCTEDPMMNLTSVQHCRLIKYWGKQLI